MTVKPSVDELRDRLLQAFKDGAVTVQDESHLHAGHAGAAGGAGHYRVTIVSTSFTGLGKVARHRLVYHAVLDMMPDRIHALAITAQTPAETGR